MFTDREWCVLVTAFGVPLAFLAGGFFGMWVARFFDDDRRNR